MRLLDKKELLELKRNYFSPIQKTLCKKFEQTGGSFTFKVDDNKFVYALIHGYSYLLFSLYMLNKHGIIHYDIKGENIMYDKSRDIPVIIDFGLSIIKKDIKPNFNDPDYIDRLSNYFYVYAPDYSLWCLDIHYLCFIINHPNSNVKNEIENMVTIYMQNNKSFHHL